ncbi:T9SS type A sorting domain-containing protein [Algibacter pacificus]|uniref:T9SS type A sorting domain-containing protein n=1 Tax=Algibacter pacificus TaxID=2599389 RepID=UPI0011C781C0|nr:T9SS type A sorting domain-containing protein [Algibacter pacificus]
MKKITLKISAFLVLTMFAMQMKAQANFTGDGVYKISTSGLTPNLYVTVNTSSSTIEWAEELPGDDEKQLWTIVPHRTPASPGLMEITGNITGLGAVTLCTLDDSAHPSITLGFKLGNPKTVVENSEDYSGLDQFQRRKTKVDENGLYDKNGAVPANGNNALFLRNTQGTDSRYGVIPAAAGDFVKFDKGGIDVIQFHLVAPLSTADFDTSSIFVSNPVNDQLTIKGLANNVNQVSVYSLLGKQVLETKVKGKSELTLDTRALSSGMYIVKMSSAKGSFSKKIVKQ